MAYNPNLVFRRQNSNAIYAFKKRVITILIVDVFIAKNVNENLFLQTSLTDSV